MSVNQGHIAALRALSKALDRECDASVHRTKEDLRKGDEASADQEAVVGTLLRRLSSACNEAAEDLNQQDLDAIERILS